MYLRSHAKRQRTGSPPPALTTRTPSITLPAVVEPLLRFLMERPRTNLLHTSKTFAPWLAERKQAAAHAMACLTEQERLCFCKTEEITTVTSRVIIHTIELHSKDSGLIHIHKQLRGMLKLQGQREEVFYRLETRIFSPWAGAFVAVDGYAEQRIEEIEEKDTIDQGLSEIPPKFRIV